MSSDYSQALVPLGEAQRLEEDDSVALSIRVEGTQGKVQLTSVEATVRVNGGAQSQVALSEVDTSLWATEIAAAAGSTVQVTLASPSSMAIECALTLPDRAVGRVDYGSMASADGACVATLWSFVLPQTTGETQLASESPDEAALPTLVCDESGCALPTEVIKPRVRVDASAVAAAAAARSGKATIVCDESGCVVQGGADSDSEDEEEDGYESDDDLEGGPLVAALLRKAVAAADALEKL